ncbi:MAG: hypothetical protein IH872_07255 [Chloroflexi bacterium]|nr:hypothetical protein [Chloroflexota bacterium]
MRFGFWAFVVIATVAMLACGGASGPDSAESGLRSRAESQAKAQSDGNWAKWYGFFSPGNKSACTEAEFSAAAEFSMSTFRESKGLADSDQLEFSVQEVTVNGDQGLVIGDIYLDGQLFFDSPNENWVFVDGDWWSVNTGGPGCWSTSAQMPAPGSFEQAGTLTPAAGAFDEADMRALLSDEEVEAAIPLAVGDVAFRDLSGFAGAEGMEGFDSRWGITFISADRTAILTVLVNDFNSVEVRQQQIALQTYFATEGGAELVRIDPKIGDESFLVQEGHVATVQFWQGDKGVRLNLNGPPITQAVLDGLIALAKLAASRL